MCARKPELGQKQRPEQKSNQLPTAQSKVRDNDKQKQDQMQHSNTNASISKSTTTSTIEKQTKAQAHSHKPQSQGEVNIITTSTTHESKSDSTRKSDSERQNTSERRRTEAKANRNIRTRRSNRGNTSASTCSSHDKPTEEKSRESTANPASKMAARWPQDVSYMVQDSLKKPKQFPKWPMFSRCSQYASEMLCGGRAGSQKAFQIAQLL